MCMTISLLPAASAGRPGASACAWVKAPACITLAISATTWTRPGEGITTRACALLAPLIAVAGKSSVVITADPDNFASRRTCERLGCVLESIVQVPAAIRDRWEISAVKCRYIWRIDSTLKLDL